MHVVLNAQLISAQQSYRSAGMSNYSRNVLAALGRLAAEDPRLRLTALTHTPDARMPGVDVRATSLPLYKPAARIAWEQLVLPGLLRRLDADLVHGLVNVLPLASSVPGVVTVHDLSFLHLPELFPPAKRLYLSALCRASVHKAAAVIAVSRQTADDVVRRFQAPPEKVTVAYNGVDARFAPGLPGRTAAFRRAKGLPDRFFLFLGTLEPRKNLETLLSAYAAWRGRANPSDRDIKLVIAGGKGWFYDAIFARAANLDVQDAVVFPGYVPDDELPDWYRAASGFVYPSVFEGFGLPALEAMACGVPVLCSDIPALREVAGDAALVVSPRDVDGWAAGLALLAGQPALRDELRVRGLARAARFTWQAAAARTLDVYRRALTVCA
jgi:glycosyltransferase involved in cell wall biosynthesis